MTPRARYDLAAMALEHLRHAARLANKAQLKRAAPKIRTALLSTAGAVRHAERLAVTELTTGQQELWG